MRMRLRGAAKALDAWTKVVDLTRWMKRRAQRQALATWKAKHEALLRHQAVS